MELEFYFKNGCTHVYSVDDFFISRDSNFVEIYAWYFKSHAKRFKLSGIKKIVALHFIDNVVLDEVVYELAVS